MKLSKWTSIIYISAIMIIGMIDAPMAAAEPDDHATLGVSHGNIKFFGFIHEQYYYKLGDAEESTFKSKRARLGGKGKINKYTKIKVMAELAGSPKLLDGVFELTLSKKIDFSIGQYKPPFGTDFLISATAFPFVNPTDVNKLGTGRDIGMSMTIKNKFNRNFSVKFDAGLFNGSGINTSDVNKNKNFISRLEIGLAEMFTIAPNVIIGKTNEVDSLQDLSTYGGSISWKWNNEVIVGEYIHSTTGDNFEKAGWYVWGGHTFVKNCEFLPEIQLLARYEEYNDNLDLDGNKVDRITLGANLFIDRKYTKISLNYQINGEEGNSIDNDEIVANFQLVF